MLCVKNIFASLCNFLQIFLIAKFVFDSYKNAIYCAVVTKYVLFILLLCSSSSYSIFIRCCPLIRDGWIYPIPSAIALTPFLHLSHLSASFFKPIFSVSSSRSSSVILTFSCHSLQDSEHPLKHCRHPSSTTVFPLNPPKVRICEIMSSGFTVKILQCVKKVQQFLITFSHC